MKGVVVFYSVSLLETAINIGYSCQLLTDEMVDVFIVDASSFDEVQQQLLKFRDNIKVIHTYQPRSPATTAAQLNQTANGQVEASNNSIGTSTPPQPAPAPPPAVSVVTFRWEYGDIHTRDNTRAR